MGRIERSVEIKAPSEKVWEMLALDRMPEWKEGCKNVMFTSTVQTPKDKYKVGATAHFIVNKTLHFRRKFPFHWLQNLSHPFITS